MRWNKRKARRWHHSIIYGRTGPREYKPRFQDGYGELNWNKEVAMAAKAYILMKVKAGKTQDVLGTLKAFPEVEQAHACFGQPDIFGLVTASDDRALSNLIMTKIHTIPGVEETDTHIVVQE
jgi:DNA-binding Lrp family transcriptional regulator